jgi:hypothetical protein
MMFIKIKILGGLMRQVICFFGFALVYTAATAYAGGKAMDCSECVDQYGDAASCVSLCGPKTVKGQAARSLYNQLVKVADKNCKDGACFSTANAFTCTWSNGPKPSNFACSFNDANGEDTAKTGAAAQALAKSLDKILEVQSDCGTGQCGYSELRHIECSGKSGRSYSCNVVIQPTKYEVEGDSEE